MPLAGRMPWKILAHRSFTRLHFFWSSEGEAHYWCQFTESTLLSPSQENVGKTEVHCFRSSPSKPPPCCFSLPLPCSGLMQISSVALEATCWQLWSYRKKEAQVLEPLLGGSRLPLWIAIWTFHQHEVCSSCFKLLRTCSSSIMLATLTLKNIRMLPLY